MQRYRVAPRFTAHVQIASTALALLMPATASGQPAQSPVTAPGRLQGTIGTLSIGTAASGVVKEVLVHEGSRVQAGQVIVVLNCEPTEAEVQAREAQLRAAQAVLDRVIHGPRSEEITVAEAAVGYSAARADEAQKTYERTQSLREGITVTTARILETLRDARVSAAQLKEAQARLALLRAGSREEDVRDAEARKNVAAGQLDEVRARLDQCSVRAPVNGAVIDVVSNPGQFMSLAVPAPFLHMAPDGRLQVRAEVDSRDVQRVCAGQPATVTVDGLTTPPIHALVDSISPVISARTLSVAARENRSSDVAQVILTIEGSRPSLPSGLSVTVQFGPCPSKS
jgi:multidrug resistance efflux pump